MLFLLDLKFSQDLSLWLHWYFVLIFSDYFMLSQKINLNLLFAQTALLILSKITQIFIYFNLLIFLPTIACFLYPMLHETLIQFFLYHL